jgi:hypothetical protein
MHVVQFTCSDLSDLLQVVCGVSVCFTHLVYYVAGWAGWANLMCSIHLVYYVLGWARWARWETFRVERAKMPNTIHKKSESLPIMSLAHPKTQQTRRMDRAIPKTT